VVELNVVLSNKLFHISSVFTLQLGFKLKKDLLISGIKDLFRYIFKCKLLKIHNWKEVNLEWGTLGEKSTKLDYQRSICCERLAFQKQADIADFMNYIEFKKENQEFMVKAMLKGMKKPISSKI